MSAALTVLAVLAVLAVPTMAGTVVVVVSARARPVRTGRAGRSRTTVHAVFVSCRSPTADHLLSYAMNLTGSTFFAITTALAVIAVLLPLPLWSRVRGPAPVRCAYRLLMVVFAQATAVLLVFVTVNDSHGLYDSWEDLLGMSSHVDRAADLGPDGTGGRRFSSLPPLRQDFEKVTGSGTGGEMLRTHLRGGISGVEGEVQIWLPPQYGEPAHRNRTFPVVELLPGFPGSSKNWFTKLKAPQQIEPLIASGRVAPFILVAPCTMLLGARDHGYANIPGRINADSWLSVDVRRMVADNFRVSLAPGGWAIAGYSSGGHGAAELALAHPDRYSAAVSLSGYNDPAAEQSSLTGDDPELRRENDVLNILRAAAEPPPVSLLAVGQGADGYLPGLALRAEAEPPTRVDLRAVKGGHSTWVWKAQVPYLFEWLTRRMGLADRGGGSGARRTPGGGPADVPGGLPDAVAPGRPTGSGAWAPVGITGSRADVRGEGHGLHGRGPG
ncbi:alpha/beta hydrolase [Streptomyces sp. NPDC051018]|uniref:alpha/beta hydrolase n=1 Tax=Streptomyces sp. NPDC051018 TaxID=3365639 RepID=UPI0037930B34